MIFALMAVLFFFRFSAQWQVLGTNLSLFFCNLPYLFSSDTNICYLRSTSNLEFYEVFLFAASLLFFLQGYLLGVNHHASCDLGYPSCLTFSDETD